MSYQKFRAIMFYNLKSRGNTRRINSICLYLEYVLFDILGIKCFPVLMRRDLKLWMSWTSLACFTSLLHPNIKKLVHLSINKSSKMNQDTTFVVVSIKISCLEWRSPTVSIQSMDSHYDQTMAMGPIVFLWLVSTLPVANPAFNLCEVETANWMYSDPLYEVWDRNDIKRRIRLPFEVITRCVTTDPLNWPVKTSVWWIMIHCRLLSPFKFPWKWWPQFGMSSWMVRFRRGRRILRNLAPHPGDPRFIPAEHL